MAPSRRHHHQHLSSIASPADYSFKLCPQSFIALLLLPPPPEDVPRPTSKVKIKRLADVPMQTPPTTPRTLCDKRQLCGKFSALLFGISFRRAPPGGCDSLGLLSGEAPPECPFEACDLRKMSLADAACSFITAAVGLSQKPGQTQPI